MFSALKIKNMMVTHQKMIVFASSIGFTAPWNIVERYSSKNCFKKVQIPKIPPWHKEGRKKRSLFNALKLHNKKKVCSFCELPAWWKTSQGPLLTKTESFQRYETSKAVKRGPWLVFHQAGSSQNEQSLLFRAFEAASEHWKDPVFVKRGPWLVFHQAGSSQNEQSLLFTAFEVSDLWKDSVFVKRSPWLVFHQAGSSQNEHN